MSPLGVVLNFARKSRVIVRTGLKDTVPAQRKEEGNFIPHLQINRSSGKTLVVLPGVVIQVESLENCYEIVNTW